MGFLNIPTSAGGFANDVVDLLANRRKIDKERELERLKNEDRQRIVDEAQAAGDEARAARRRRKLEDVGDTPENQANLDLWGEDATVLDGKLYKNRGGALEAWRSKRQDEVNRDALAQKERNYDSELATLRANDLADQQEYDAAIKALGPDGATPEALARLRGLHAQKEAEAQQAFHALQAKYLDPKTGNLLGGKGSKEGAAQLDAAAAALKEARRVRQLMAGDRTSVGTSESRYRRGVSEGTKALLEAYLVNNPPPDLESRSGVDRDLAASMERRLPNILRASRYAPDEAKVYLEQLKQNSAQGDAATRSEEKTYNNREANYTRLLTATRSAEAMAARDAAANRLKEEALRLKKIIEDNKIALGDRKIASQKWIANQHDLSMLEAADMRGDYNLLGMATQSAWAVPELEQFINNMRGPKIENAAARASQAQRGRVLEGAVLAPGGVVGPGPTYTKPKLTIKGKTLLNNGEKVRTEDPTSRNYSQEAEEEESARARLRAGKHGNGDKKAKAAKATKKVRRAATADDFAPP